MAISKLIATTALLSVMMVSAGSAKVRNQTLYDQAQHLCYDDAMRLCKDDVPDEDKVQACMTKRRAELSPACAKVFDEGTKN